MEEESDLDKLSKSFSDWKIRMRRKWELIQSKKKPVIKIFKSDHVFLVENGQIRLLWEVENAHSVRIDNKVGRVNLKGEATFRIPEGSKKYTITAYGGSRKVSQSIDIQPEKFSESVIPKIELQASENEFSFPVFQKSDSEKGKKNASFKYGLVANDSGSPILLPNPPSEKDLQRLRSELSEDRQIQTVEELRRKFKELKESDLLEQLDKLEYEDIPADKK